MKSARISTPGLTVFALALFCSCAVIALAEPERGRMADGRAYRVDSEGNQLVDYIAELELSVDGLNRRVQGLEDEVIAKQQIIDRLSSGQPAESRLVEKDIVESRPAKADSFALTDDSAERIALAEKTTRELDAQKRSCEVQAAELKSQLASLQSRQQGDYSEAQARISETRALVDSERQSCEARIEKSSEKIALLEESIRVRDGQIENMEADLKQVRSQSESLRRESEMRARMMPSVQTAGTSHSAPASPAKMRALDTIRGSINTELNQIGTLLQTRDRLVAQYGTKTGTLSFKPSRAVSASGLSVDQIRVRVSSAASVSDLSQLRYETSQIKNRIQEDIALIKRMFKVR